MDRTHFSVKPPRSPSFESSFRIESGAFSTPTTGGPLSLFAPMHYERAYRYPLIVWLHGQGNDERQLLRIMPHVSMRNYMAVAPRGVCSEGEVPTGQVSHAWDQSDATVQSAEQQVMDAIDAASRKFRVHQERIFLAGFDCGATMAFRIAMNRPSRFAGVLSLGGPFPRGRNPFGNLAEARQLPVFLAVGRDSRQYSAEQACDDLRLFHAAGLSVTLRQYPCGHELTPQMLGDVDRWIMEQISPSAPSGVESDSEWAS